MTTHYRLTHIDLSTRFQLATQMLSDSRPWGMVTRLKHIRYLENSFIRLRIKLKMLYSMLNLPVLNLTIC